MPFKSSCSCFTQPDHERRAMERPVIGAPLFLCTSHIDCHRDAQMTVTRRDKQNSRPDNFAGTPTSTLNTHGLELAKLKFRPDSSLQAASPPLSTRDQSPTLNLTIPCGSYMQASRAHPAATHGRGQADLWGRGASLRVGPLLTARREALSALRRTSATQTASHLPSVHHREPEPSTSFTLRLWVRSRLSASLALAPAVHASAVWALQ